MGGPSYAYDAYTCMISMQNLLSVGTFHFLPQTVGEKQRLVIVNLQATPLDNLAALRVNAKCDDFTKLLMEKLKLEIPQFRLQRRLLLKTASKGRKVLEVDLVHLHILSCIAKSSLRPIHTTYHTH